MSCRKGSVSSLEISLPPRSPALQTTTTSSCWSVCCVGAVQSQCSKEPAKMIRCGNCKCRTVDDTSFGYQVLAVARETLDQLESVLCVRLVNGAPPHTGPLDPDGVGLDAWQVVLYSTSTTSALDIVHFMMKHKVAMGQILHLPTMTAACQDGSLVSVPDQWTLDPRPAQLLKPFAALPPRGRRHILCQPEVEQQTASKADVPESQQEEEQTTAEPETSNTYIFSVFGGIYLYKDLFDDLVGQMLGSLFRVRFKLWGVGCKVWGPRIFGFRGLGLGLRV